MSKRRPRRRVKKAAGPPRNPQGFLQAGGRSHNWRLKTSLPGESTGCFANHDRYGDRGILDWFGVGTAVNRGLVIPRRPPDPPSTARGCLGPFLLTPRRLHADSLLQRASENHWPEFLRAWRWAAPAVPRSNAVIERCTSLDRNSSPLLTRGVGLA